MSVAEEFDRICEGYTGNMNRWIPCYQTLLTSIIDHLPAHFHPQHILDLGCGNGNVTALLLDKFPNASFTLFDASTEMLKVCRNRFTSHDQFQFIQGYFQDANFGVSSFDLIVGGLSLHHLEGEEKQQLFRKALQWLTLGGCLSASDLFVEKNDEPRHSTIIAEWKKDAFALGTVDDEWEWIMDHYDKYDRPNSFENQLKWLIDAGFSESRITWQKDYWGNILAVK